MIEIADAVRATEARFALIQAGLDRISQGLTVFDGELRLIGWNRTFFELLEFPLEMARAGTPFAAFMRHNALRGEYGEGDVEALVERRVEAARSFQPHLLERVRPSGQIIEVRGEPLPGGGFVTIYTDISERRRYEQLIRRQNEELDARVRERTAALEAANAELQRAYEERKRAEAALVQAQKMEAVGKLTGGLAHDFNNLLTIIIGNLAAIDAAGRPEIARNIAPALEAARRGAALIRRLLAFARRQPLEPVVIDIAAAVRELLPLLRRSLPEAIDIATATDTPRPALASADPNQLDSAILNLALNARDAMPGGGALSIGCTITEPSGAERSEFDIAPGAYVRLTVADTGSGMDAETLKRAFEPFFTSKEFGRSSGLGLAMVYGFARQSRGGIRLDSALGQGTTATLLLPLSAAPPAPPAEDATATTAGGAMPSRLVLLVEDEPEVRRVVRRQLQDIGHLVVEACDANEALALLDQARDIAALVCDIVMPGGMSGIDLAEAARARRPDVQVVLMTGYDERAAAMSGATAPWPVLHKPFSCADLAHALEARRLA